MERDKEFLSYQILFSFSFFFFFGGPTSLKSFLNIESILKESFSYSCTMI